MIPVLFNEQMRELDFHMSKNLNIPSLLLMENAAFGLTRAAISRLGADKKVVVVCGAGSNGGDGFAAARQLSSKGCRVRVLLAGSLRALEGDAAVNAKSFNGSITELTDKETAEKHLENIADAVVIDALLGSGLSRDVTGLLACIISLLNSSGAYIIACDIASGIDADTGAARGVAVKANETVTFQYPKPGHFLYPGRAHTGKLTVKEIGVADGFQLGEMFALTDDVTLPRRGADTHKGSFGRLACVVGSQGMSGAGILCAVAAMRAGAGLTTAGIPASLQSVFSSCLPQSMTFALEDFSGSLSENCLPGLKRLLENKTALAAGPGLSVGGGTTAAVRHMLQNYDIRKVFDADALNIIARDTSVLRGAVGDIVLTPHIAEFSRLCGASAEELRQNSLKTAREFAKSFGVTLLLKGPSTIVTNGTKTAFVTSGTAGMARGGSGDILTGVIGGLMCGGCEGGMDGFNAAMHGAYICGKAGESAAEEQGELSMSATDTLRHISKITKGMLPPD
ncbi:MAG: NAD(P)H-hydrate dehydratase [Christensenellales bacterium]